MTGFYFEFGLKNVKDMPLGHYSYLLKWSIASGLMPLVIHSSILEYKSWCFKSFISISGVCKCVRQIFYYILSRQFIVIIVAFAFIDVMEETKKHPSMLLPAP